MHHGSKNRTEENQKHKNQRQRRPANLPARFAFRHQIKSNSKATQNGARSHQKYPNKSMGWPPDSGVSPTVSQVCTNEFISGQDNANGEKTRQLQESSLYTTGGILESSQSCFVHPQKRLSSFTRTLPWSQDGQSVREDRNQWRTCSTISSKEQEIHDANAVPRTKGPAGPDCQFFPSNAFMAFARSFYMFDCMSQKS